MTDEKNSTEIDIDEHIEMWDDHLLSSQGCADLTNALIAEVKRLRDGIRSILSDYDITELIRDVPQDEWNFERHALVRIYDIINDKLNMVEIKQVSLWRAEGPNKECYPIIFVNSNIDGNKCEYHSRWEKAILVEERTSKNILQDVQKHLFEWGKTAPKNGGYDKTDFRVDFDNGFVYEGTFNMQFGGLDSGQNFTDSLRYRMTYYSNAKYPEWMSFSKEEWEEHQDNLKIILEEWITEHDR